MVPRHVGIIMDGNRRWAKEKGLPSVQGHAEGAQALERVVKAARKFGVKYLTVYALSTENLTKRSKLEVAYLFKLLVKLIREKVPILNEQGVKLRFVGSIDSLPLALQKAIYEAEKKLAKNEKLVLNIAINYGGRQEIVEAVKKFKKIDLSKIKEKDIEENLFTAGLPDPDLIIRTGGQMRLSNFLLWQSSYSELYFTNQLWPDFDESSFKTALDEYKVRVRNFGR